MDPSQNIQLSVATLRRTIDGIADSSLMQEITELESKIVSSRFYLVIMGMFKRGKSSLINKLLEKDIPPVGVVPLTAIITLFEYAPENYAEVIFNNGKEIKISSEAIEEFVTEEKNPENIKDVRYVKIFDNAPLLRNIHLVDTPGLGSEFEHNTQTTLSFIPKVDAALFVMSADTPVSKADLDLLKRLHGSVPRLLFVLNKADLLSPRELQAIDAYNKKAITSLLPDISFDQADNISSDWVTVSTKPGHPSFDDIEFLRRRLIRLSEDEKKNILEKSTTRRFHMLFSEAEMQVRLQLKTLQMPLHELEEKQRRFQESLQLLQGRRSEFDLIMKGRITQLRHTIEQEVVACEKTLHAQLQERLTRDGLNSYDTMIKEGIHPFQDNMVAGLIQEFDKTKRSLEETTRKQFRDLLEQYCSRSQSFLNELAAQLHALWGIDYRQIGESFNLNAYTAFYFDHGRGEKVVYIKPSFMLKNTRASFLKKHFTKKLYRLYEQILVTNTSGIIYDLQYKVQESFRQFNYDLEQHLNAILDRIGTIMENTLQTRRIQSRSVETKVSSLEKTLEEMEHLKIQ